MSLRISIPKSVFLANVPIEQGWQKFKLGQATSQLSKAGDSTNYFITCTLVGDPTERTIDCLFNTKGIKKGYWNEFLAALAKKTIKEVHESVQGDTFEFDFGAIEGAELLGKVTHKEEDGKIKAQISGWAHPDKVPF